MLAFVEGTAASFLLRLLLGVSSRSAEEKIIIFILLAASITMAEVTLNRSRKYDVILVLCLSFVFWAAIWMIAGQ
jgi:hypothetical protein